MIKKYNKRSTMDYRGKDLATAIDDIDKSYNHYGILTRLDRVLALTKKGFTQNDVEYGLRHFINMVDNKAIRSELQTVYLRRGAQR